MGDTNYYQVNKELRGPQQEPPETPLPKVKNKNLTLEWLDDKATNLIRRGYKVSQWINFSRHMLNNGVKIMLNEAELTKSKYLYLTYKNQRLKIRFSEHGARPDSDCDFEVGPRRDGDFNTTEDAYYFIYGRWGIPEPSLGLGHVKIYNGLGERLK